MSMENDVRLPASPPLPAPIGWQTTRMLAMITLDNSKPYLPGWKPVQFERLWALEASWRRRFIYLRVHKWAIEFRWVSPNDQAHT